MRLVELTKRVSLQQLYRAGHFTDEELFELRKNGWRIVWQEKPKAKRKPRKIKQWKKNGIPVEKVV